MAPRCWLAIAVDVNGLSVRWKAIAPVAIRFTVPDPPSVTRPGMAIFAAVSATATDAAPRGNDLGPVRSEIGRIVVTSVKDGQVSLSQTDHAYIGSLIAQRTGLSQPDAEKRLDEVIGQAKAAMGLQALDVLADRGYFSGEEVLACEGIGVAPSVAAWVRA